MLILDILTQEFYGGGRLVVRRMDACRKWKNNHPESGMIEVTVNSITFLITSLLTSELSSEYRNPCPARKFIPLTDVISGPLLMTCKSFSSA